MGTIKSENRNLAAIACGNRKPLFVAGQWNW
jgi:hypothetical protein